MARGLLIAYAFTSACASSPWHWRWRATQDHEPDLSHAQQYGKKVNASALLRVTFEDARRAFKRLDTKYLLIYGTALGFHRSGDFIPWDYDVDVGVFFEDLPPHDVLQRGMARFGLTPFSAGRSDPYSWRCDFRSYPILYQYRKTRAGPGFSRRRLASPLTIREEAPAKAPPRFERSDRAPHKVRPRDRLPRRPLRFAPQRGGGLGLQPRAPLPRPGGQLHGLRAAGRAAFDGDRPPDRSPVPLGARGVARGHLRRRLAAPVRAAARRSAISRRRRRGRAPGSSASTPRPRRDGSPRSLDCRAGARAAATSGRGAIAKRRIRASGANRAPPDASAPSLGPGRRRRGGTDATRGL